MKFLLLAFAVCLASAASGRAQTTPGPTIEIAHPFARATAATGRMASALGLTKAPGLNLNLVGMLRIRRFTVDPVDLQKKVYLCHSALSFRILLELPKNFVFLRCPTGAALCVDFSGRRIQTNPSLNIGKSYRTPMARKLP